MLGILRTIFRTGCKPEQLAESNQLEASDQRLEAAIRKRFNGSLAIRQVDAGSCNGCELEIHASNNCYYDLERFGCHFVASPRHADMLLVTGPVTRNMATALQMTFDAMPAPKLVVAVGYCSANCGVFGKDNYAIAGTVSDIIPVDITVHGCPPTPTDIIRGILKAIEP